MMSGIQHFEFCRRQWALIHIEQQWAENKLTAEGKEGHTTCHDESRTEKRGDTITIRGMRVISHKLKLSGVCDVVECHYSENGICLNGYEGKWSLFPVEYKHGHSKDIDADRIQLCAQGIALEEMMVCEINYGYLYYMETKRREKVEFSNDLRAKVYSASKEMNDYFCRGWTPKVKTSAKCKSCSLHDLCVPKLNKKLDVKEYIRSFTEG